MANFRDLTVAMVLQLWICAPAWSQSMSDRSHLAGLPNNPFASAAPNNMAATPAQPTTQNPFRSIVAPQPIATPPGGLPPQSVARLPVPQPEAVARPRVSQRPFPPPPTAVAPPPPGFASNRELGGRQTRPAGRPILAPTQRSKTDAPEPHPIQRRVHPAISPGENRVGEISSDTPWSKRLFSKWIPQPRRDSTMAPPSTAGPDDSAAASNRSTSAVSRPTGRLPLPMTGLPQPTLSRAGSAMQAHQQASATPSGPSRKSPRRETVDLSPAHVARPGAATLANRGYPANGVSAAAYVAGQPGQSPLGRNFRPSAPRPSPAPSEQAARMARANDSAAMNFAHADAINRGPASFPPDSDVAARPITADAGDQPQGRPKIIFRPAVPAVDGRGNSVLRPDVLVADINPPMQSFPSNELPTLEAAPVRKMTSPGASVTPTSGTMPPTTNRGARRPYRLAQQPGGQPLPPPARMPAAPSSPSSSSMSPLIDGGMPPGEEMPIGEMGPMEGENVDGEWMPPDGYPEHGAPAACGDGCCNECGDPCCDGCGRCGAPSWLGPMGGPVDSVLGCLYGPPCYQGALGVERVMFAPFFIDTTQPLQNCRVRFDFAWDEEFPDRAEYFWAKTPNGRGPEDPNQALDPPPPPRGEPSVDYQDIRFYIERGTPLFSVATELPIRIVDPEIRPNTAGLGDMNVTTKAVLLNGRKWQLSQLFRSYFPTGSAHRGTGNGHVSLEPGVAYRYKFSDITYFHGDLKYWFPLGADPDYGGQFLNYGIGVSHVAVDRDCFAVIPTLELVAWTVLDGRQTPPGPVPVPPPDNQGEEVDNMSIVNLCPGVRFVWDNGSDCSTRELGISAGMALSDDHWYDSILRVELRWSY